MLICPHCQFENPAHHRFCQACGNPLQPLQGVIIPLPVAPEAPGPDWQAGACVKDWLVGDRYLDSGQRYQLRYPQDGEQSLETLPSTGLMVALIDCQPGEIPPLEALAPETLADLEAVKGAPWVDPYLTLSDCTAIPMLHGVWQRQGCGVLILEDRSHWPSLEETLQESSIHPLEVLHWCFEMTDLWQKLTPWGGEGSLLAPGNLCVDEDRLLYLRQILVAFPSPDLAQLGHHWQSLLAHWPDDTLAPLQTLATTMASGEVASLAAVQAGLRAMAEGFQGEGVAGGDLPLEGDPPGFDDPEAVPGYDDLSTTGDRDTVSGEGGEPVAPETPVESLDDPTGAGNTTLLSDDDLLANFDEEEGDLAEVTHGEREDMADLPTMALPVKLFRLDEVGRTHVGRQRDHNEDTFFAHSFLEKIDSPQGVSLQAKGLYILCDGMGGHAGGEVASALAVTTLVDYFQTHWQDELPDDEVIKAAIAQANQVIFDRNDGERRIGSGRMGTTLVLVLLQNSTVRVAHVGDSRLYTCTRRHGLRQLTVDHEVGQREIQRGVEPAIAYARADAYQLTQALGPRKSEEVVPSVTTLEVMEDLLLLLCSDGLSDNDLLEAHSASHVEPLLSSSCDLEEGVIKLIELANDHNGHDNITAVAVRLKMRPNLDVLRR